MVPTISRWESSSVPMSVRMAFSSGVGMAYRWLRYRRDAPISPWGPPYWLMMSFASLGLGFLMRMGYCSRFS